MRSCRSEPLTYGPKNLHLVERFRRSDDGKTLIYEMTVDDPKAFTRVWSTRISFDSERNAVMYENACAENAKVY